MDVRQLLQDCCAKELDCRYAMHAPFRKGEHVYATDGRIMVRVPIAEYPDAVTPDNTPPCEILFTEMEAKGFHAGVPAKAPTGAVPMVGCDWCGGTGTVTECRECKGTGIVECYACGEVEDCDECDGTGETQNGNPQPCANCGSTGQVRGPISGVVMPHECVIDEVFMRILTKQGATIYEPIVRTDPARFTAGCAEGFVMPRVCADGNSIAYAKCQ